MHAVARYKTYSQCPEWLLSSLDVFYVFLGNYRVMLKPAAELWPGRGVLSYVKDVRFLPSFVSRPICLSAGELRKLSTNS